MSRTCRDSSRRLLLGVVFCLWLCTNVADAQDAPAEVIKTRQQGLKDLGAAFKIVRDQLHGSKPDAAAIKTAAIDVKKAADGMTTWFPKGTGKEAGVKTGAKAEVWSDATGFATVRQTFIDEASKFVQAANAGDLTAVNAGLRGLGAACKGCHDKYRDKED